MKRSLLQLSSTALLCLCPPWPSEWAPCSTLCGCASGPELLRKSDPFINGLFQPHDTHHRNTTKLHDQKSPAYVHTDIHKHMHRKMLKFWATIQREIWKGSKVKNIKLSLADTKDTKQCTWTHHCYTGPQDRSYSYMFWTTKIYGAILLPSPRQPLLQKQQLPICKCVTVPVHKALWKSSALHHVFLHKDWTDLFQAAMQ